MASLELRRLWALHEIDSEIREIQKRAAALDIGQAETKAIHQLEAANAESSAKYKALVQDQADASLQKQGAEDKIKHVETTLYSGTMNNPREVANMQKELEALGRSVEALDAKLAEIHKELPPLKVAEDKLEAQRAELKKRAAAKLAAAHELKPKLEAAYKAAIEKRSAAVKQVSPAMIARYDAIKNRQSGIGMGLISKTYDCGACGTKQPERIIDALKSDRLVTCESCHRILYYTEGVV